MVPQLFNSSEIPKLVETHLGSARHNWAQDNNEETLRVLIQCPLSYSMERSSLILEGNAAQSRQ